MKGPRWWMAVTFAFVAVISFADRRIRAGYSATLTFLAVGVPVMCVIPSLQKHFVKGIFIGAIKT